MSSAGFAAELRSFLHTPPIRRNNIRNAVLLTGWPADLTGSRRGQDREFRDLMRTAPWPIAILLQRQRSTRDGESYIKDISERFVRFEAQPFGISGCARFAVRSHASAVNQIAG